MRITIPKGELLSYAFAPYGEDDKDGRFVAKEDLILATAKDHTVCDKTAERRTGLTFAEAYAAMKHGKCIRRAEWLGYWEPGADGENILMRCKDGRVFSMKDGCAPMFTLSNTIANDWIIVDEAHKAEFDKIHAAKILMPAADQKKAERILAGEK